MTTRTRRPATVRCPGCDQPAATGGPTTDIPSTDYVGRPGYSARGPNAREVRIVRTWHVACINEFEDNRAAHLLAQETQARYLRAFAPVDAGAVLARLGEDDTAARLLAAARRAIAARRAAGVTR